MATAACLFYAILLISEALIEGFHASHSIKYVRKFNRLRRRQGDRKRGGVPSTSDLAAA